VLKIITDALLSGRATVGPPGPRDGFAGAAVGRFELAEPSPSPEAVVAAAEICPSRAISLDPSGPAVVLDEGRCVFCGLCAEGPRPAFRNVAEEPAIVRTRGELLRRFALPVIPARPDLGPIDDGPRIAEEGARLSAAARRRLGRSLHVRHVDAGGCNGCEWELNQLQAP
jgi:formate hydrogenlyase subunit 7